MVNALELAEELQARTDFSERDARGIVYAISRAIEDATANLVTTDHLDLRMAELRTEIAQLRAELKTDMAELRAELKTDMAGLRADMAELRSEVRSDIAALRVEMNQAFRAQTIWLASTVIGAVALIIAADKLIP